MNFRELCNSFNDVACVVSVRKKDNGYGEIRIVDGSDKYLATYQSDMYFKHEFIPNSLYTDYLLRNLNFEEYCYRCAVKKELLHSYAYPEYFKTWIHMLFIPLEYETKDLAYCVYIMNINNNFNPDVLSQSSGDIDSKVLKATLRLANTKDFKSAVNGVTEEVRKICDASYCCILLLDELKEKVTVLAQSKDPSNERLAKADYSNKFDYDFVKTWENGIANSNCIIINDEKGMEYLKEKNVTWYNSLVENNIKSLVLFRLKSGNDFLGYMWVSNFKVNDTPKIKEVLEVTTFILGSEIGNHLLVDQLTQLSSIDVLTGLFNRNKMNSYMNEISETNDSIALVFLDINGLKKVNDVEGHIAGDNLIKRAASVLKNVFVNCNIFRAGGDEFVVILKNVSEEQILVYIEELKYRSVRSNVSFAYGYSITNNSKEIERILKEADVNMYNNKRDFYNSLHKE